MNQKRRQKNKPSWKCLRVEIEYESVSQEIFNEALDEWAKLVYDLLCQLEDPIAAPDTLTLPDTQESEDAHVA